MADMLVTTSPWSMRPIAWERLDASATYTPNRENRDPFVCPRRTGALTAALPLL